jgi:DNA-binding CsgD family transcriptional regulator
MLAAAQAKLHAGESDAALDLLATAEAGPLDELGRARVDLLRAQIAFASSRGNEAPPLLLAAAKRLEALDIELARDTYLETFSAATFAGRFARTAKPVQVAEAVPRAPTGETRKGDTLLEGLAALFTDGYAAAIPVARRALKAFSAEDLSVSEGLRWLWLASVVSVDVWDDECWHVLSARHVTLARDAGALGELLLALNSRIIAQLFAGELMEAASLVDEANAVREATGSGVTPCGAMALAAWRGREEQARPLIMTSMSEAVTRGEGLGVTFAHWTSALLFNGLGRYEDALVAAHEASKFPAELCAANWGLTELVEAAARTDAAEDAATALDQLAAMARASGTDWALGVESRSRALLSEGDAAERLYREAIERLGRTRARAELARARLLYGEWLRREGRRLDARDQLRTAHDQFSAIGAEGFGERARRELLATGETARKRTSEARERLTDQEAQIARLAARERTNSEIGAQLLISPRTVEWHLGKVFTKLGISSRKELCAALPAQ